MEYYLGIKSHEVTRAEEEDSRLGGDPVLYEDFLKCNWLQEESLKCGNCGSYLYFILQAKLPLPADVDKEKSERLIYVFMCNTRNCMQINPEKSILTFFVQRIKKTTRLSESIDFSSRSLGTIISQMKMTPKQEITHNFQKFKLNVPIFPVMPIKWTSIRNTLKREDRENHHHDRYLNDQPDDSENYEQEAYENTYTPVYTKEFSKFERELAQNPWQLIRYSRGGLAPLFYSEMSDVDKRSSRTCKCGSKRVLECQLMPAILSLLPTEDDAYLEHIKRPKAKENRFESTGLDWGTVFIFTCSPDEHEHTTNCEFRKSIVSSTDICVQRGFVICQYDLFAV